MKRLFMVILLLVVAGHGVEAKKPAREDSKVKNIIYMIGDGMGSVSRVDASDRGGVCPYGIRPRKKYGSYQDLLGQ